MFSIPVRMNMILLNKEWQYTFCKASCQVKVQEEQYFTILQFELIGVLRHMQRYFSQICDGTDVQVDWRRSCTYGRAPNAIDISQGSLTCPSFTDTGTPFLYGDSDTPPH